jgi:hypothetical protein
MPKILPFFAFFALPIILPTVRQYWNNSGKRLENFKI